MSNGLIHLYHGDGKGKTTAAMGLAVRALGCGRRVVIVQFLKGGATGELEPLQTLGATFYRGKAGQKFVFQMNEEEKAATRALQTENLRRALAEPADLLILDEFLLSPVSTEQTRELLEIIEARSVKGSVIFCTQFEPKGWYSHIGSDCDATTCEAIIDRIIHKEDFII